MASPPRVSSEPLRATPTWPTPPSPSLKSTSSSQVSAASISPNSIMKALLDEARKAAETQPAAPPPPPPTLQELISQSTTTHLQDKLITNPKNLHHYKTHHIIGSSGKTATVYNAVYWVNDSTELSQMQPSDLYVAVKVINMEESREEYEKLVQQVNKILKLEHHPNLLQVKEEIVIEDKYWVVFLLLDGSLRCLINSVFSNGVSEEVIAIVLKEVLKGLAYLHQQGELHKEVNASHIYYGILDVPVIKIGYLATIYERNSGLNGQTEEGNGNYLPIRAICEWAAAPEIYQWNLEYTDKADVWLVGILAIELAFGGIRVKDRKELERLIAEVTSGKWKGKKKLVGKFFKKVMRKIKVGKSGASSSSMRNDVNLSQGFRNMLAQCLNEDAEERASADALLQHDFFKICDGIFDVYYFRNAVDTAKKERGTSVGTSTGSNEADQGENP